jgi:cytochrome c6
MNMKRISTQVSATATAIAVLFILSLSAQAQDASAALYKTKCASCHGADGTGSAMGKKMGAHDFTAAGVQGMSDEDLIAVTTTGKAKMPGYGKSMKADDIKGLVAYIRTLKKS